MQTYKQFKPTSCDTAGLSLSKRQEWLVVPCGRNRDSGVRDESNFAAALKILGGESETVEVHRFGHWAYGWLEIVIVKPDTDAAKVAGEIEATLADYSMLDDADYSERESIEANQVWAKCYDNEERIAYIREHRSQFEFRTFSDMLGCVRGNYFAGYASELIEG